MTEYIAGSVASREVVGLRELLTGMSDMVPDLSVICCDYQSCEKFSKVPAFYDKSGYVEIKYFRDPVFYGAIVLQYDEKIADILTKSPSWMRFAYFREKLRVVENVSLAKREC